MRAILCFAVLFAAPVWAAPAALEPSEAPAQEEAPRFELGLAVGYAYGLGRETRDAPMPDLTFGTLPVTVDLNYAVSGRFAVGAYGGYGLMFPNGCPDTASCSGRALRLGLRARYRFSEGAGLTPWLSLGMGYERLTEQASTLGTTVESAVSGLELLRAELGVEQRVSRGFALGPYLGGALGEFLDRELAGNATRISPRALHFWVVAGLRTSFWL